MAKPSRNQPCPCGSGKKHKLCCANEARTRLAQSSVFIRTHEGNLLALPQALHFAIELHQAGCLRKAGGIYQQILQIQPNHADALHLLGLTHHQLGNHDLAFSLIAKAISFSPRAANYHNNLGEVCRALNRPDEALAHYANALSLQTRFPEAHRNIGLAHLAMGKVEEAVSHLRDALKRYPDYLGIYLALGQALAHQRRLDEAVEVYDNGLARHPADSALLCAKGIALRAAGKLEETIQHYRRAVSLQPRVPELYHNLALVLQQRGNIEEAIASLKSELSLSPHAESAQHLLAALQNTPTERAPASYVRETFDAYAEQFDDHLTHKLGYRTPRLLADILRNTVGASPAQTLKILDLGCGTGLFGEEIKDLKKRLVGIDLSPRMIEKARQRELYDALIVGDLLDHLKETAPGEFNLVAATDVFNYIGNLLPVFEHASRILNDGGLLTFSIEASHQQAGDFILDQTGRYQHHQNYLARLGAQFGFAQIQFMEACLREEKGKPVTGYLYLLRKI